MRGVLVLLASVLGVLAGCGVEPPPDSVYAAREFGATSREPCADRSALRKALFGDLHIHTAYSNDAWNFGVRAGPDDAYRFAFGGELTLPSSAQGAERRLRLERPLDFAAVTDHAEFLGEQAICLDRTAAGYDSDFCSVMRSGEGRAPALVRQIISPFSRRSREVCGQQGERCAEGAESAWVDMIAAAQSWNDKSADCERTTFIAYEYSSFRMGSNLHRNVIFRNSAALARPVSYIDEHREWGLWRILKEQCIDSDTGCDVLAIPHNSNISNGRMFAVDYPGADSTAAEAERAALRQKMEPLVEIMQHKGDSECRNGLQGVLGAVDELCATEQFEDQAFRQTVGEGEPVEPCYDGPFADWMLHLGPDCLDRKSYVRYALIEGLAEQRRIGVNPFKFGLMASTDTHNASAGAVQEGAFEGHLGSGDATPQQRVAFDGGVPGNASNNPGGLIGVWATENSRDAIFTALRAREVFGTSGPRIEPRFFAGWSFPRGLCEQPDMLEQAYALGVPMGADLPTGSGAESAPLFLAVARADPGTAQFPGTPLQRLQIVKGWADDDGNHHQRVFDVAGDPSNGASVDATTCESTGEGFSQLCAVWRDPEFDATQSALYYLRVVENPTCRYSARQCLELPADERPQDCANPFFAPAIQERAWSSPIWYSPRG